MAGKPDLSPSIYTLGILSIVFGIFTPIAGIVLGIIGIRLSYREKNILSAKGAKLCKIGIIVGVIMFILLIIASYILQTYYPQFALSA